MPTSASVSHTLSDISVPMLTLPDGQGSDRLTATQPLSFDRSFKRSKVEIGKLLTLAVGNIVFQTIEKLDASWSQNPANNCNAFPVGGIKQ